MAGKILVQLKDGAGNELFPQVTGECVPDGAVTTERLADNAVTEKKLATVLSSEIANSKTMADTLLEGLKDPGHLEDPFVRAGIIPIPFEDEEVKKVCVANFDKDGDGEVSYAEAQAVTEWPATLFRDNTKIRKFREFRFFGGLQEIESGNYWDGDTTSAFGGCTNLTDIEFPPGLGGMFAGDYLYSYQKGEKMFIGCTSLALTKLPDDWTELSHGMFRGCTSLKLAYLPSGLTEIRDYAFQDCTSLALTELPSGVTSIGSVAFQGCTSLALTELPSGVTSIGSGAFQGCTSLALTELPSGLSKLGTSTTFAQCTSLALTKLPDWLTEIGYFMFDGCANLALTSLPPKLEKLDACALRDCGKCNITSIPETVKEIVENPFGGCGGISTIKEASLPDLQSIGWNGLGGLTSLESLTLGATPPSAGMVGLASGCTIYVPDDAVDTYKAATGWADYADRIKGVSEKT